MNREFIEALEALEKEKHISKDVLLETIESALVSAYKKNYGTSPLMPRGMAQWVHFLFRFAKC